MTRKSDRIGRIERSLTPGQAVLLWMEEAHKFESIQAFALSLVDQPDAAFPLYWLYEHVVPAMQQVTKGQPRDTAERAERAALRDTAFLFFVHQQANARILQNWRALHLNLALLFAEHRNLKADRRPAATAAAARRARRRSAIEAAVVELCALTGALDRMAARYFRGRPVLFPETADGLAFCVAKAETLAEMHNDAIEFAAYPRKPAGKAKQALIDEEVLKTAAAVGADRLAEELSALARAETLALMREDYAIAEVIRPYVGEPTRAVANTIG